MTHAELLANGLCEICQAKTDHGPWTAEQLKDVCDDLGTAPEEFADWCDDCFVSHVGMGDAVYAQTLAKRPLRLTRPDYVVQLPAKLSVVK